MYYDATQSILSAFKKHTDRNPVSVKNILSTKRIYLKCLKQLNDIHKASVISILKYFENVFKLL